MDTPKRRKEDNNRWYEKAWIHQMAAYVLIVCVGAWSAWLIREEAAARRELGNRQDYDNCVESRAVRQAIRDVIVFLGDELDVTPTLVDETLHRFPLQDCNRLLERR